MIQRTIYSSRDPLATILETTNEDDTINQITVTDETIRMTDEEGDGHFLEIEIVFDQDQHSIQENGHNKIQVSSHQKYLKYYNQLI